MKKRLSRLMFSQKLIFDLKLLFKELILIVSWSRANVEASSGCFLPNQGKGIINEELRESRMYPRDKGPPAQSKLALRLGFYWAKRSSIE